MTYEEAVQQFLVDTKLRQLMFDSYLDADPLKAAARYLESEEFSEIRRILQSENFVRCDILDLGAGNGVLAYALAKAGYNVKALEPENGTLTGRAAMKGLLSKSDAHFEILEGWGEAIPLKDLSVDVVIARQVLHHAENLQKMCQEAYRVLKRGGLFLALREHVISKESDRDIFLANHPMHRLTGQENAHTLTYYLQCIKGAGFSRVRKYGFWESVLNYAPIKKSETRGELVKSMARRIPVKGSERMLYFIFSIPGMQYLMQRLTARVSNVPGRLYSFIAEK